MCVSLVGSDWIVMFCFFLFASFAWALTPNARGKQVDLSRDLRTLDDDRSFPKGFLFGCATAAYQVEGAWNASGKGENMWDHLVHTRPEFVLDHSNGDVACDSYHKYKEDVKLLKSLGMDFYRFSLSWSRLLPTGAVGKVNKDGVAYYGNLINELLVHGIQPVITLYHWDLPQPLQDIGGWPNPLLVDYFVDYADFAFSSFGSKVRLWTTFNEPFETCANGYGKAQLAPAIHADGVADYLCAHTILRAHARAYRLYHAKYAATQRGKVSITLNTDWFEPRNSSNPDDRLAAERMMEFMLGWFAHPIYSEVGDYPAVLRQRVMASSAAEGRSRSRLPAFTPTEVSELKGSSDFFGLNHYTTRLASPLPADQVPAESCRLRDHAVLTGVDPSWPGSASPWLKVVPWGFRKLLVWIRDRYRNVPVLVTENGFSDHGEINDADRVNYHTEYLEQLLKALYVDKCPIFGYTAWSLLDNFEWADGYGKRFGLHYVNFSDPNRPRSPKLSAALFKKITSTRRLPTTFSLDPRDELHVNHTIHDFNFVMNKLE